MDDEAFRRVDYRFNGIAPKRGCHHDLPYASRDAGLEYAAGRLSRRGRYLGKFDRRRMKGSPCEGYIVRRRRPRAIPHPWKVRRYRTKDVRHSGADAHL